MTENSSDNTSLETFRIKFLYETIRTVVFWICVVLATYLIFIPIEAKTEFESYAIKLELEYKTKGEALKVDYQRTVNELNLKYNDYVKKKVFEQRMDILDQFIINSDAYTKTAYNVFEKENAMAIDAYKESAYNLYHLQIARMLASFGSELQSLIDEASISEKALFSEYKEMVKDKSKEKDKEIWEKAYKDLVKKNIEITKKATMLQFGYL